MRHLGLEIHRLEKMMARRRGYSAAHQDADRLTGMHGYLIRYLYENQGRDVFQKDIEEAFNITRSSVTATSLAAYSRIFSRCTLAVWFCTK